jgi:hypothetical protein
VRAIVGFRGRGTADASIAATVSQPPKLPLQVSNPTAGKPPGKQPVFRRLRAASPWPPVLVCSAVVTALVVFVDAPPLWRPLVTLWFLAMCPGMALIGLLRFDDQPTVLTLAIVTSLAADALVAIGSLYLGLWSPSGILAVLIGLTLAGAIGQLVTAYWQDRASADAVVANQPPSKSLPERPVTPKETVTAPPGRDIAGAAALTE